MYINEIIRITYKCNWSCRFCNVIYTNNFWDKDISCKKVTYEILSLINKYTKKDRESLILSFSWWEPTLNKNLLKYIKLAKSIWVWNVQIQTNWTFLFLNKDFIKNLIDSWLDTIFLAQHSNNEKLNFDMGCFFKTKDFIDWVKYIKWNLIYKKIVIEINIVINKLNIFNVYDYIIFLLDIGFFDILKYKKISFWFCQPNWYAQLNSNEVVLNFDSNQLEEVDKILKLCEKNSILADFHYTSPPLCILNYKKYNLEYQRLKALEIDKKNWDVNYENLNSYKFLWREKIKFTQCSECRNNNYCLWFYKNRISIVWKENIINKINNFIKK